MTRTGMKWSLLTTLLHECPELLLSVCAHIAANEALLLSMACRELRALIDSARSLLARFLAQTYPMPNCMLQVAEYAWEININIDAYMSHPTNNLITGALSGQTGEEVIFDVNVVNTTARVESAIPLQQYAMRHWRVVSAEQRDGRATIQAHYKWTTVILKCIDTDYALAKPTYLRVRNMIVHVSPSSQRCLLATRMQDKCMTCGYREGTWISYACAVPNCRRLCHFCISDRMISEKALKQRWRVSHNDVPALRKLAFRFHSTKHEHNGIRTLIPRASVLGYFGCRTWPEFLALTAQRAERRSRQC